LRQRDDVLGRRLRRGREGHHGACRACLRDELLEVGTEMRHRLLTDLAGAVTDGLAALERRKRLPARGGHAARADGERLLEAGVGQGVRGASMEGQGRRRHGVCGSVAVAGAWASTSAMWRTLADDPWRSSPPCMCMAQLISVTTTVSAPASVMCRHLRASMAPEMSAIFTAKSPPNPQQVSASASGTSRSPAP